MRLPYPTYPELNIAILLHLHFWTKPRKPTIQKPQCDSTAEYLYPQYVPYDK
jgi:hypothetical protein